MASRAGRAKQQSALAELRALKQSGKKRIDSYKDAAEDDIYEEVDEEGYKKVVRERLDKDDFVVDDDGIGYADNGQDDWERREAYSDEETPNGRHGKHGNTSRGKNKGKRDEEEAPVDRIRKYLVKKQAVVAAPVSVTTTEQDNDFMAGLMADIETPNTIPVRRRARDSEPVIKSTKKRAASPPLRSSIQKRASLNGSARHTLTTSTYGSDNHDDAGMAPANDDVDMADLPVLPSSPAAHAANRKKRAVSEDDDEEEFAVKAPQAFKGKAAPAVNLSASRPVVKAPEPASSPGPAPSSDAVDTSWQDVNKMLTVESSPAKPPAGKLDAADVAQEDGSILFYWTDYLEINGVLGLFGKVRNHKTDTYASAFCRVDGILRNLYFLPRDYVRSEPEKEVTMSELHAEVMSIMSKFKVTEFKAKKSTRKYAFELPNIPAESDYLKVLYGYKAPSLPADLQGECFSHVFGTNTALFEQFVLFRRILGPCWLRLNNPDLRAAVNTTWTRFEFGVDDPEHITPIQEPAKEGLPDTPPMTVMSVALRTVLNKQDNKTEIVVASARTYNNVNLDDPIPADKLPCTSYTVVRPPSKVFPNGFEAEAKRQNIAIERSETALLNSFMARWHMSDPDIIVGHDWESVGFGVLLARLKEKRITTWHRVGRYKRSEWPRTVGRAGFFAERQLAVGRLMCDLSNDLGRSIIRAQSWTLTEICKLELGITRPEVDNEKAATALTETARGLLDFTMRCSMDTHYQTAIAIQVQILPLSKQLTCLAGNSWAATLSGTRAQRNEFILLHEFHKNKYICPDKVWGKQKAVVEDENEDGDAPTGKKKDKFKGGLVFEPEKGLYDKFILVMDFNSLYPSIIQEYNICFTTVVRSDDLDASGEEVVPDPPPSDVGQGILPRLIATLVERRREVKKLFKMKDATDAQKAGWDIRQLALKLTANSMYGCLGYTRSRFYARPLAMLTTFKGREVLTNTKELADDQQLQVIYGDTDSVMINTNVDNYLDAMKIGNEFKKNVNERYRLLEIDIDNVFQRMLLHAKKKYAALVLSDERGKLVAKTEVKGLDMRRREYCMLSKEASQYCLDRILSGEQTELVVEQIHNYLRDFSAKMRAGEFSKGKFIILNKLGKEPEAYPNGKTMPHVQVALKRRAKGDPVRVNDVMQYIITGEPGDARHVAERAYPAGDVTRPKSELNIDYDWYLAHQILPPLERLCAPIEGTDRVRIAECLGLDPNKYKLHEAHEQQSRELTLFESTISDEERFADAEALRFRCRNCAQEATYAGLVQSSLMAGPQGLQCHRCQTLLQPASIEAQLQAQICKFIAQYYENWLVCDDSACGTRTQQCGVYGRRCLNAGCRGMMSYAYNDKMLYNQLLYFDHVFDVDKAMTAATVAALGTDEKVQQVRVHAEQLRVPFDRYRGLVNSYLRKCGRRYVDMASLFAFCQ